MEKPRTRLVSMDAHPTEPWIITGHECGRVAIQNHDTQAKTLIYLYIPVGHLFSNTVNQEQYNTIIKY
jgi:coatomer subunit beta'